MTYPLIKLSGIKKQYNDSLVTLRDIDMDINGGEILGLIGSNGSGKSTLLGILAGSIIPSSGTMRLFEQPADRYRPADLRRLIGIASQDQALDPEMTVKETLVMFAKLCGVFRIELKDRISRVVRIMKISKLMSKRVAHLSGGQRQRVHLALVMLQQPDILLLDEPVNALDPGLQSDFWTILRSYLTADRTIIVATHDLNVAEEFFDRIAILSRGSIVAIDRPQILRDKYARPRLEILFSNNRELPSSLLQDILELPAVSNVEFNDFTLNVRLNRNQGTGDCILEMLRQRRLDIAETREYSASLSEAFFNIVGEQLQPEFPASIDAGRPGINRNRFEENVI